MLENATTDNITKEDIEKINEFRQLKIQYDELFKKYQQIKAMEMEATSLINDLKTKKSNKIYEIRGFGVILPVNRKEKIEQLKGIKKEIDKQLEQTETTLKMLSEKLKELEPIIQKIQERLNSPNAEETVEEKTTTEEEQKDETEKVEDKD